MSNRSMERYSTSLVIREMKSKPTMKYHFAPTKMAIILKRRKDKRGKFCQSCQEIGTHIC